MSYTVEFTLSMKWYDARVTWNNLNQDSMLNIPAIEDVRKLWTPNLVFWNTDNKLQTDSGQEGKIFVEKEGNYTLSPDTNLAEVAIYSGSENGINFNKHYHLKFKCNFDLQKFPFDSQTCYMILRTLKNSQKFINLINSTLDYLGPSDVEDFHIQKVEFVRETFFCAKVKIKFKRRIDKHVLSTYLQSLCILITAQVKSHFILNEFPLIFFHVKFRVQLTSAGSISKQPFL